jgi:hypothetical protein
MPRFAPDLQHHGAQRIAGERIGRRPQCTFRVECAHRHQTARIEAELGKPAHRQRAHLAPGKVRGDPQQRPPSQDPCGKPQYKPGRAGAVPAGFSEHLMRRAQGEPALQGLIGLGMAQRSAAGRGRAVMRLKALDVPAQSRKRAHACAGHAPLL